MNGIDLHPAMEIDPIQHSQFLRLFLVGFGHIALPDQVESDLRNSPRNFLQCPEKFGNSFLVFHPPPQNQIHGTLCLPFHFEPGGIYSWSNHHYLFSFFLSQPFENQYF